MCRLMCHMCRLCAGYVPVMCQTWPDAASEAQNVTKTQETCRRTYVPLMCHQTVLCAGLCATPGLGCGGYVPTSGGVMCHCCSAWKRPKRVDVLMCRLCAKVRLEAQKGKKCEDVVMCRLCASAAKFDQISPEKQDDQPQKIQRQT